jgi:hypothetical protein
MRVPTLVSLNVIGAAKTAILWVTFGQPRRGAERRARGLLPPGERWRLYRQRVEELMAEGVDYYELAGGYKDAKGHHAAFRAFAANVQRMLAQEVEEFIAEIARAPEGAQTQTSGT